jgi:endo-1,4-beta-D-glucanase Y
MLLLHLGSCVFLYFIAKKLTKSQVVAAISVLFFSLSPLGIYFQRRVLLDNIMIFWLFLSFIFILYHNNKLRNIFSSAMIFAVAVLSKETAIFFIPVFLYVIFEIAHKKHRIQAMLYWVTVSCAIISFYFIYALLKGEFFASGTLLGGNAPHVSMLTSFGYQVGRGGGSILTPSNSIFWSNVFAWIEEDPIIIIAGILATFINLIIGIKNKTSRIIALLSISYVLFLARGGVIIEYYVIPLIPLFSLNIAFVTVEVSKFVKNLTKSWKVFPFIYAPYAFVAFGLIIMIGYYGTHSRGKYNIFTADQTIAQIQALNWEKAHQSNYFFVIDDYGYVDIHATDPQKNAEYYWKVALDPAITTTVLHNNPANIDYFMATPQMSQDIISLPFALQAFHFSRSIKSFWHDGWGVRIWATAYPRRIVEATWNSYKQHFISQGKITTYENMSATSDAEGTAMFKAVNMKDKTSFDTLNLWTEKNLEQSNGTFLSTQSTVQNNNSSQGDEDIALSLLEAYKVWNQPSYLTEAKDIMNGIWNNDVKVIGNTPYYAAGNWADVNNEILINTPSLSPAAFKTFAQADPSHNWTGVVDSSYSLLNQCTVNSFGEGQGALPATWCMVSTKDQTVQQSTISGYTGMDYSQATTQVPLNIALDYKWFQDPRDSAYLSHLSFLYTQWKKSGVLENGYLHNGNVLESYESVGSYAGDLGYFMVVHPNTAKTIYTNKILSKLYENANTSYWEDPNNNQVQNLAWLSTSLYGNLLQNYWGK